MFALIFMSIGGAQEAAGSILRRTRLLQVVE
jgi:hypothetical protein